MNTITWEPRVLNRRTIGNINRVISESRDNQYIVIDMDMSSCRVKRVVSFPDINKALEVFKK